MDAELSSIDKDDGLSWRLLDESVKAFEKQAHPLAPEEYTAAVDRFLTAVDAMESMDDLDELFEVLYEVCHRHAGPDVASRFLEEYSVKSRELGVRVAQQNLAEVETAIAELKKKRDELIGAETSELISQEESREQRKVLNNEINNKIRDTRMLRALLANRDDDLEYARKHGRYMGHKMSAKKEVAAVAPSKVDTSLKAEPIPEDSQPTPTSESPPKKRVRIASVDPASAAESSTPEAERDDSDKILVTWPQPCDRCKKLGKQCTRGQERILRCTECGSPRLLQCLYNGVNAYGEVKDGKKTLAQFNGLGFSFHVRLSQAERTIAEQRVRDIIRDWRAPLWVNQTGLVEKLKHFNPSHAAITDFRHPPDNQDSARALTPRPAEASVTRKRAAREHDAANAPAAESVPATSHGMPREEHRESTPQAALPDKPVSAPSPSKSSTTPMLSDPVTPSASHAYIVSPTPQDHVVAQIRARYNALYADHVVIGRQLANLRHEEEEQTGQSFGTYTAVARGFAVERPLDDGDFSARDK
ncbi:hypothetical protein OH77DRAFT_1509799 [Trametes cingulata]|nr:hypothetical protein OH77DRAFT_1509799 [Trametes cingulata]